MRLAGERPVRPSSVECKANNETTPLLQNRGPSPAVQCWRATRRSLCRGGDCLSFTAQPALAQRAALYNNAELEDVYSVYSTLLREHRKGWGWDEYGIQRNAEVENLEVEGARPAKRKAKYRAEVEDFIHRSKKAFSLTPRFDQDLACSVISEAEVREDIQRSNTPPAPPAPSQVGPPVRPPAARFRHIFVFSAVGFNADRSRAVVYVGHHCGMLCGMGTFAALTKSGGKWRLDLKYRPAGGPWRS